MRDPKRIRPFLDRIAEEWEKYPDLRFGQLVLNTVNNKALLYNIEDDMFLKELSESDDIDADYTGAYDYFSLVVECGRNHICPDIVKDFYELLKSQGFRFVSGFWEHIGEAYETIIQTNQDNLEKNLVDISGDDDTKDNYLQLLFDYDGNNETRSYISNSPKDNMFTFHIIIPEEDILTYNAGTIHYFGEKVDTLIELAKRIWELPFVDCIQTYLECSDVPKTMEALKNGVEALSVEPLAIIPNQFDKDILSIRYDVTDVSKDGLLVRLKNHKNTI